MRIICFPKFIATEESEAHSLRNCSLVIDGLNFFYNTYLESGLPYVFGAEANEYARYLRNVLKLFKRANVNCYFIFKGGDVNMDKKILKLKPINYDIEILNNEFVPPIFMKEVYKQVLDESGLKYATCVTEAKDDCVALAQALGCAVLSNDITYCFKKVPYISYQSINIKSHLNKNYIPCKKYNLKNFLKKHSLTEKKAAMFVVLSDTKIFPQDHFNDLLQTWDVVDSNLYVQNKKLLMWLSKHSEDEVVDSVLKFLSKDNDSNKFMNEIENILDGMQNSYKGIVSNYLDDECTLQIARSDPQWFEKGVATQHIPIVYINMYKHSSLEGSRAIEKKTSTDSIMFSMDIIKYAYNLLTNFQPNYISVYIDGTNCIKVYTGDLEITQPIYQATESVFQNGWTNIKCLKLFEHFLTENNINTEKLDKFPVEARMLFITLAYFYNKKVSNNINVIKQVYCFIICYVILHVVFDNGDSLRKIKSGISEKDSAEAIQATEKYFKANKNEAKNIFDEDELKTLVELEHCLLHMNYLNRLCGAPYKTTTYHRTYNGTFIYKLLHDMKDYNDEQFIESLFKTAPSVQNFVNTLISSYKELIE